jgi:type I restriction enzyme S subunit
MVKKATGASYPAVSDRIVLDSNMPLPPLPEQRRIADILDKADAIRRKRKEAIALTEELLRSAFLEMFGDPVTNPKGWPMRTIGELCEQGATLVDGPFGSSFKPEHYTPSGVRVVRNWNIYDDRFDAKEFKFTSMEKFEEVRRSAVTPGDVLITTKGTVGDVCLMPDLPGPSVLSASGTVRLRLPADDSLLGQFVVGQMIVPTFKRYLHSFEAGSAQQYLNLSAIKKLRLMVPPVTLQQIYVGFHARCRRIATQLTASDQETDSLFSILAEHAFHREFATACDATETTQLALFDRAGELG